MKKVNTFDHSQRPRQRITERNWTYRDFPTFFKERFCSSSEFSVLLARQRKRFMLPSAAPRIACPEKGFHRTMLPETFLFHAFCFRGISLVFLWFVSYSLSAQTFAATESLLLFHALFFIFCVIFFLGLKSKTIKRNPEEAVKNGEIVEDFRTSVTCLEELILLQGVRNRNNRTADAENERNKCESYLRFCAGFGKWLNDVGSLVRTSIIYVQFKKETRRKYISAPERLLDKLSYEGGCRWRRICTLYTGHERLTTRDKKGCSW